VDVPCVLEHLIQDFIQFPLEFYVEKLYIYTLQYKDYGGDIIYATV
jgi:hypothetical protein